MDCVGLKRWCASAMEPVGFAAYTMNVLAEPYLSLIGIMLSGIYGIAARYFLVRVLMLRKDGLGTAVRCCGMGGPANGGLNDLKRQRKRYHGPKHEAIDSLYRYISVNEEQMRYDMFRAKGYDIGSGVVEVACGHAVDKRLKQSGMIWTRAGSSATLALRITWLNNEREQLWLAKPLAA